MSQYIARETFLDFPVLLSFTVSVRGRESEWRYEDLVYSLIQISVSSPCFSQSFTPGLLEYEMSRATRCAQVEYVSTEEKDTLNSALRPRVLSSQLVQ